MTPVELSRTVLCAVRRAVDAGELRVDVPERVSVTPPGPGGCGDYATGIALKLARPAGEPPLRVAEILRPHLGSAPGVKDVVVTGPGFLNITLQDTSIVEEILRAGPRYGHVDAPTAELTRLHAPDEPRAVVVMDTVARVLRTQGTPVRTSCDSRPPSQWTTSLGVEIDTYGTPEHPAVHIRPLPARLPLPALGRDATRWALLHPAPHDHAHLTPDHLVQRESNPLFRVRYAHARTRALTRNAASLGFTSTRPTTPSTTPDPRDTPGPRNPPAHQTPPEPAPAHPLHLLLADHPRILTTTATHHTPHRLTHHLVAIADALLPLLPYALPTGEEKPEAAHRTRLALAEAAGTVLAGGLSLLGIDAPEHL
ncbi:ArgS-related anticodon-binding protein NrtL [Streptomyces sp. NPDC004539]|uniref:ArgS-related anticodon-binding protein NrtL n=1 Tax=Streptomyces sp. NPDC004539 TaxID=3154280 RepID=UPI0033B46097